MTSPGPGASLTGTAVTVAANAADNVAVAGVQFLLNGQALGSEVTRAPYTLVWDTTRVEDGRHTLKAVARDSAGNSASSPAVEVSVNNTPAGPTLVRWGRIRPNQGTVTPIGVAVLAYRRNGILINETGVAAALPAPSGRFYVEIGGRVVTGIAAANPGTTDATISFHFTDAAGADFGHAAVNLPAGHQIVGYLNEAPFTGRSPMHGTFSYSASAPVSVTALRGLTNERGEFLTGTLPVTPVGQSLGSQPTIVPHLSYGGGWNASLVLVNPLDAPISGVIEFFNPGSETTAGAPAGVLISGVSASRFSYTVPSRGMARLDLQHASTEIQVHSVRVIPASNSSAPKTAAVLTWQTNGVTVSEITIPAVGAGLAFRSYAETGGVFGQAGSVQTGVAVANPSSSPAIVTVELAGADGTPTGMSKSVTLPGNGQMAPFINGLFPELTGIFRGVIRVTSTTPVHVSGTRGRFNERGEFLAITMPAWNEAESSSSSESIVPYVAGGEDYSTQLILFTVSPSLGAKGELAILTPTGKTDTSGLTP
jgi:hypothetical protein